MKKDSLVVMALSFILAPWSSVYSQSSEYSLIPAPIGITAVSGTFTFQPSTSLLFAAACEKEVTLFGEWLQMHDGVNRPVALYREGDPVANSVLFTCSASINLRKEDIAFLPGNLSQLPLNNGAGSYKITMTSDNIMITAPDPSGLFYATQTLQQMIFQKSELQNTPIVLPCVNVIDKPMFAHRGLLLDCCRHFMSKDFVKRYIDLLAMHKMNVLHWHLTEDQAWRIEINAYPRLTSTGAYRMEDNGLEYGGFYSQDDIREIVAYATARHVMVIPEIELPGHSVAAIASYPELSCTGEQIAVQNEWGVFKDIYCAGNENTFVFLEKVLDEVCALFPSPYIHIGGDEVPKYRWEHCDKCQKRISEEGLKNEAQLQTWFIERIASYLQSKGKQIIGWDEIIEGGIPENAVIQVWRDVNYGAEAVTEGHYVVMSPTSHCYFDYGLESIDLEKVYSFDPIPASLPTAQRSMIRGGECTMWTERAPQELVDGKLFPRILAMSEVLWTYPAKRDYKAFKTRTEIHQRQLNAFGVTSGFSEIPVTFSSVAGLSGAMNVTVSPSNTGITLTYLKSNIHSTEVAEEYRPVTEPISVKSAAWIDVRAALQSSGHSINVRRGFSSHAAYGKPLTLSYSPSKWYTGGGENALVDGRLGTDDFRDGTWQAVQGGDMQATTDLGQNQTINFLSTRWYHYTNAWIFRPEIVTYEVSEDGTNWTVVSIVNAAAGLRDSPEQRALGFDSEFELDEAPHGRYVRMTAKNSGPCPEWHDAVGEPSWLFVDEFEVR